MSSHLTIEVKNGKSFVKFVPDAKMFGFAAARALPENLTKKDKAVCESINLPYGTLERWRAESNPYFDEWVENYLLINSGGTRLLKKMLEDVGIKKAMEGDFAFWKAMAIKHGVIAADSANLNVIPVNLQNYDQWTPEQLEAQRNTLLSSLIPMAEGVGPEVAATPETGGPESDPARTPPLPE